MAESQLSDMLAMRSNLRVVAGAFVATTEGTCNKRSHSRCASCTAVEKLTHLEDFLKEDQRVVAKTASLLP